MKDKNWKNCEDKVQGKFDHVESTFKRAREYYESLEDDSFTEVDNEFESHEDFYDFLNNYGLSWDYVEPNTFDGQERGYFRYQLSWGGPADEFRIFLTYSPTQYGHHLDIDFIEYWFLDWYDGASIKIDRDSESWSVCESFLETDSHVYDLQEKSREF